MERGMLQRAGQRWLLSPCPAQEAKRIGLAVLEKGDSRPRAGLTGGSLSSGPHGFSPRVPSTEALQSAACRLIHVRGKTVWHRPGRLACPGLRGTPLCILAPPLCGDWLDCLTGKVPASSSVRGTSEACLRHNVGNHPTGGTNSYLTMSPVTQKQGMILGRNLR